MHDDTGPHQTGDDGVGITIQLTPEVARALSGTDPPTGDARRIVDAASRMATSLKPVHPGVNDPELATWYTATVRSTGDAERLLDELMDDPAIQAAYIKPTDFPP